ncbi:HdeD family acid-resistance protein [Pseudochrobactrum sp. MP213Fo]|uniref:HdeD family acid-resistance protein n=1 Tax=Pseudochrobactrum sp. MP213Fo TaxID=3022250 RepID=UPI003BA33BB8
MSLASEIKTPGQAISSLSHKWGWFIVLGIAMLMLGGIAFGNLVFATVASVYYVGIIILVAGLVEIIHAFSVQTWKSFFFWMLSGLFYAAAGILTFMNPFLASSIFTLMIAIALVGSGLFRMWVAFQSRSVKGWGWLFAGGLISVLAGIVIAIGWPVNSLWILGMFLAIDLVFQGWAMIALGFGLKTMRR